MSYDNTNTGLLAKNQRKEQDNHPDYTGSINVDGVDYWLSAWIKTGKEGGKLEGQKFFSLSLRPKDGQQAPQPQRQQYQQQRPAPRQAPPQRQSRPQSNQGSGFDDMEDDIPF
jgi:single-stranded DNA-binding protein